MSENTINKCPIILVPGFFCTDEMKLKISSNEAEKISYWEHGYKPTDDPLNRFETFPGPLSSYHDRACELYAQIKGSITDYGIQHAYLYSHARYGKQFSKGIYPEWSAEHPVHLVGHSAGANTCRVLQQLLADDTWFAGTNDRWVRSISCISGQLRGTTAMEYMAQVSCRTGRVKRPSQIIDLLKGAKCLASLVCETEVEQEKMLSLQLDHFGINDSLLWKDEGSMEELNERFEAGPFTLNKDNIFYDMSIVGSNKINEKVLDYPETYYFSYVTDVTAIDIINEECYVSENCQPLLQRSCLYQILHTPTTTRNKILWKRNDGIASARSQELPRSSSRTRRQHGGDIETNRGHYIPGLWYTQPLSAIDHFGLTYLRHLPKIIKSWKRFSQDFSELLPSNKNYDDYVLQSDKQLKFYQQLFEKLESLH